MALGTILILTGPDYEDLELWYPKLRLEEAGYVTPIAGIGDPRYAGKHGYPCTVDGQVDDFDAADLVGIVAPGGWAPDRVRRNNAALRLVREVHEAGGLVATICHGPWILISAGVVRGRTLTSSPGIRDDLINAGATWVDQPVACDGNIISSRAPGDLPAFGKACVDWLSRRPQS